MSPKPANLDARLEALRVVRETGEGRLTDARARELDAVLAQAGERRRLSPEHTVVGVFGATGSGKSSLVNALVGTEVAVTHVRRPTTSEAHAVAWDADGGADLLDWLGVRERTQLATPIDPRARSLLLLDLPDVDSVEAAHRAIAERLAAQVDALVWVVDPQKYADEVLHAQFIAPHARHAAVTLVVLNQIDLLPAAEVPRVVESLRGIVERDGIPRARILAVSARTGEGIPALRTALGDLAAAREAREARLAADVGTVAAAVPTAGTPTRPSTRATEALVAALGDAAGAEAVALAVSRSYRKRAGQATGWPLVSWLLRFRPDPLARLGLGPSRAGEDPEVHRTSMPALDAGARAKVSLGVRGYADAAAAGLTDVWRAGVRATAERAIAALPDELDRAIARTRLPAGRSWWWLLFTALQWVAALAAVAGIGWLLAAGLLPTFGLPAVEVPKVEGWAVPTLLISGGIALGVLLGLLGAALAAATAAVRRRTARRRLLDQVGSVVRVTAVEPIADELDRAAAFDAALALARAG
ncbi:MAG: 50S ribosome-binding GTPase [Actinomycetales bacterium]|nr:50S ribosome-binding GTPase [Actinomycetales bacterium]